MRITKVRVELDGKKEQVTFTHNIKKGDLLHGELDGKIDEILDSRLESFKKSILNKTIVKSEKKKNKKDIEIIEKIIIEVLNNKIEKLEIKDLKKLSKERIKACLKPKFQENIRFINENNEEEVFQLSEILELSKHDKKKLDVYARWTKSYIEFQKSRLKLSIEKNKLNPYTDGQESRRAKVLKKYAEKISRNEQYDFKNLEEKFDYQNLISKIEKMESEENDKGFNQRLRNVLREHQKFILEEIKQSEELHIYTQEVVKYFTRNFPFKTKDIKNRDKNYYLKEETIKRTVENQLKNSIIQYIIQYGKALYYGKNNVDSSKKLTEIKIEESFILNLLNACGFAANNIRNIIETDMVNDVLVEKDLKEELENIDFESANKKVKSIFSIEKLKENEMTEFVLSLRASVSGIRNNILHFKKDALNEMLENEDYERTSKIGKNILETSYRKDLELIPYFLSEKIKSSGALEFYDFDKIVSLLQETEFSLSKEIFPFAPSFKNIYKQGVNYQKSKNKNYDLNLSFFIDRKEIKSNEKESYEARYYLLKMIYNELFLKEFFFDKDKFSKTVKFILDLNKMRDTEKKAFTNIRDMKENESIREYMSYVQGDLILEMSKESKEFEELKFGNFILQVFIKGFQEFLENKKYLFINTPKFQFKDTLSDQEKSSELNSLEEKLTKLIKYNSEITDLSYISFYGYCKLLDSQHLASLKNEFVKYTQSIKIQEKNEKISEIKKIIELCLLSVDRVNNNWKEIYVDKQDIINNTQKYIEDNQELKNFGNLFLQEDGETPVIHRAIELLERYGTKEVIENLLGHYPDIKIKIEDYKNWSVLKQNIFDKIYSRDLLHIEWVNKKWNKEKEKEYQKLCEEINEYNALDNKISLVNINKIHRLVMEILGRMTGYICKFDRDFIFFGYAISELKNDDFVFNSFVNMRELSQKLNDNTTDIQNIKDIDRLEKKDRTTLTESDRNKIKQFIDTRREIYNSFFFANNRDIFKIRNYIAHFNYLTKREKSILDLIKDLRGLMAYDRKLKNSVTKSIINIFDKHGITLSLEINSRKDILIKNNGVISKKVKHLRGKILLDQVHRDYIKIAENLLDLK